MRNRLTQIEFFKVGKLLENMAVDGHIKMFPGDIQKIVKAELGIEICTKTLRNAAKGAEVQIRQKAPYNKAAEMAERIALLEHKVDLIVDALPGIQNKLNGELL
jgi:hypothetical protein